MNQQAPPDPKVSGHVLLTDEEVWELINLIDENEVDEHLLVEIRHKLAVWRRKTRQRYRRKARKT